MFLQRELFRIPVLLAACWILLLCHTNKVVGADTQLLLFSDESPRVFLGCLTCSSLDSSSVWNSLGKYGSSLGSYSVRNSLSKYGSTLSQLSACNTLAQRPPLIVDESGGYYGRLTVNRLHQERSKSSSLRNTASALCQR